MRKMMAIQIDLWAMNLTQQKINKLKIGAKNRLLRRWSGFQKGYIRKVGVHLCRKNGWKMKN